MNTESNNPAAIRYAQAATVGPSSPATIDVQTGTSAPVALTIRLEAGPKSVVDTLLPTIPGVVVALVGLIIAHWLTQKRDRRKELAEVCSNVKELADDAAQEALLAWRVAAGEERTSAIHNTKRKLQTLGIAATTLAKRTSGRKCIDLAIYVADLRRAATSDPFEEPDRPASTTQEGFILGALAALISETDRYFIDYAGR